LTLGSIPEIPFIPPQVTSDLQSNLPEDDPTFDTHDSSLATDLAQPELLVDTPPRDVDRPP
jgi:hypothetical protein